VAQLGEVSAPSGLQLDLLTAIVRIEQAHRDPDMAEFLLHRLATCDVRRLRTYLSPETLAWEENADGD
jgi:hypothetical protein